jgi:hypothetical protein
MEMKMKDTERLLPWNQHGDIHHTFTNKGSGIVYPHDEGFHWEVFGGGDSSWHDQAESLHSAKAHVEGTFVGRGLI